MPRTHGCEPPYAKLQIISWFIFPIFITSYYLLFASVLDNLSLIISDTIYTILTFILIIAGLTTTFTDPTIDDINKGSDTHTCVYCMKRAPNRSKHCKTCDRCVDVFDHHCEWLNNCIGRKNYNSFFISVLSCFLLLSMQIIIGLIGITQLFLDNNAANARLNIYFNTNVDWTIVATLIIIMMIFIFIVLLSITHLLGFHIVLIIRGLTTYESIMLDRRVEAQRLQETAPRGIYVAPSNNPPTLTPNLIELTTEREKINNLIFLDELTPSHEKELKNVNVAVNIESSLQKYDSIHNNNAQADPNNISSPESSYNNAINNPSTSPVADIIISPDINIPINGGETRMESINVTKNSESLNSPVSEIIKASSPDDSKLNIMDHKSLTISLQRSEPAHIQINMADPLKKSSNPPNVAPALLLHNGSKQSFRIENNNNSEPMTKLNSKRSFNLSPRDIAHLQSIAHVVSTRESKSHSIVTEHLNIPHSKSPIAETMEKKIVNALDTTSKPPKCISESDSDVSDDDAVPVKVISNEVFTNK